MSISKDNPTSSDVHVDAIMGAVKNSAMTDKKRRLKKKRMSMDMSLKKGDFIGHPFRGNQWTRGMGVSRMAGRSAPKDPTAGFQGGGSGKAVKPMSPNHTSDNLYKIIPSRMSPDDRSYLQGLKGKKRTEFIDNLVNSPEFQPGQRWGKAVTIERKEVARRQELKATELANAPVEMKTVATLTTARGVKLELKGPTPEPVVRPTTSISSDKPLGFREPGLPAHGRKTGTAVDDLLTMGAKDSTQASEGRSLYRDTQGMLDTVHRNLTQVQSNVLSLSRRPNQPDSELLGIRNRSLLAEVNSIQAKLRAQEAESLATAARGSRKIQAQDFGADSKMQAEQAKAVNSAAKKALYLGDVNKRLDSFLKEFKGSPDGLFTKESAEVTAKKTKAVSPTNEVTRKLPSATTTHPDLENPSSPMWKQKVLGEMKSVSATVQSGGETYRVDGMHPIIAGASPKVKFTPALIKELQGLSFAQQSMITSGHTSTASMMAEVKAIKARKVKAGSNADNGEGFSLTTDLMLKHKTKARKDAEWDSLTEAEKRRYADAPEHMSHDVAMQLAVGVRGAFDQHWTPLSAGEVVVSRSVSKPYEVSAQKEIDINNTLLGKGDFIGHPFRGNQWQRGRGGMGIGGMVGRAAPKDPTSGFQGGGSGKPAKSKKTKEEKDAEWESLNNKGKSIYSDAPEDYSHDQAMMLARMPRRVVKRGLSEAQTKEYCSLSPREGAHYEYASASRSHASIMADIKAGKPVREPAAGMKRATPADIARIRKEGVVVAPAWSEVHVAKSKSSRLQVTGIDEKGRVQSGYSKAHKEQTSKAKFAQVADVEKTLTKLDSALKRDVASGKDEAVACLLIRKMGLRPGGTGDTGGAETAFGATTLQRRHVTVRGNTTTFEFTGKKGVKIKLVSRDPEIAKAMSAQLAKGKRGGDSPLFESSATKVNQYLKQNTSQDFSLKDLRTALATRQAFALLKSAPAPTTMKEARALRMSIGKEVAQLLGNTPNMALTSYINPTIFAGLVKQFGPLTGKAKP